MRGNHETIKRLKSQPWQKLMDFSTMFLSPLDCLIPISSEIHFASCKIKGKTSLFDCNLFNISQTAQVIGVSFCEFYFNLVRSLLSNFMARWQL